MSLFVMLHQMYFLFLFWEPAYLFIPATIYFNGSGYDHYKVKQQN
jgi:hypothetical protein